ncbi:MAG: hypothetical protein R2739_03990 [Chitinophagales bacterium]|nr:hypothetical protein [Bacteroidota bacterium]
MKQETKANFYFIVSLIGAIWFAITSYLWMYYANIFISFPVGILAFFCWYKGKKIEGNSLRFKIILSIMLAGVLVSALAAIYFL